MSYADRVSTTNTGKLAVEILITDHETVGNSGITVAQFSVAQDDTSCRLVKIYEDGVIPSYESNYTQALLRSKYQGTYDSNIALMYDNAVAALAYCVAGEYTKANTLLTRLTSFGAPIYTAVHALSEQVTEQIGYDINQQSYSSKDPLIFNFFVPAQSHTGIEFNFGESSLVDYDGSPIDYRATAMIAYALGFYSHWNDGLEDDCATFADALIAYDIPTDLETAVLFYYALQWAYVAIKDRKYRDAAIQVKTALVVMTPSGMRETALYATFLSSVGANATSYIDALIDMTGDIPSTFLAAMTLAKVGRVLDYEDFINRYPRLTTGHYSNDVVDTAWHVLAVQNELAFELLQSQSGYSVNDNSVMNLTRQKSRPMRTSQGSTPMGLTRNKTKSLGFTRP